ncbi:methyltransferase domain-containing protein [Embleya hyalina]|uniref:Methyltransferase n=1 Tax=Embleya hyalina TaxID=516124 RepID=A0A401Z6E7_9ACTN|nr:methyltransferase domain-containing protein [Embleya hyalina]GCE02419.1 methyltransferase [Embleya hyalina]
MTSTNRTGPDARPDVPTAEPDHTLLARLDAVDARPDAVRLRARTYALLAEAEAEAGGAGGEDGDAPFGPVLDVGCGAGLAVAELAARGVRAVGLDLDPRMLAAAELRHPTGEFRRGDAHAPPFADASFGGYRADKVLHESADPAAVVAQARRVLRPGGRIVLTGQDWDTILVDAADPALTRTLVHARADRVPGPRTARRYRALLLDAGFRDVRVEVDTWVVVDGSLLPLLVGLAESARANGTITADGCRAWIADQRERANADRSFVAVPMFVAAGTRP